MYISGFRDKENVANSFCTSLNDGANILFAEYITGDYEGSALVIFSENGKLYEVQGSHCSCNGLEGQWEPEETSLEVLQERVRRNGFGQFCLSEIEKSLSRFDEFDLDSLPDAQEFKKMLSFDNLIKNKNILNEQDNQVKSIQQKIIECIKTNLFEQNDEFSFTTKIHLSEEAQKFKKAKPEELKKEIDKLFEKTSQTLNNKGYAGQFLITDKLDSLQIDFDTKPKKTKKIQCIKPLDGAFFQWVSKLLSA